MTIRQLVFAAFAAALFAGQGPALGVECTVCDRKLVDCRSPAQAKFVACMNDDKSSCNVKCSNDCKAQRDAQRCTLGCVKSCQGSGNCRVTYLNVTNRCSSDYQACKKDCTIPPR